MISLRQGLSVAAVTLLMSLSVAGCKSSPPAAPASTPAAAPADTTATAPASAPAAPPAPTIPASNTPVAMQSAATSATVPPVAGPPPPPPAPVVVKLTAPVGASVKVMINQQLSASKSDVGNIHGRADVFAED